MHCITWIGDYGRQLEAQGKQFRLLLRNYDEFASVFIIHSLLGREAWCHYNWEVVVLEHEMLEVMEQFIKWCSGVLVVNSNCYIELQVSLLFADLF